MVSFAETSPGERLEKQTERIAQDTQKDTRQGTVWESLAASCYQSNTHPSSKQPNSNDKNSNNKNQNDKNQNHNECMLRTDGSTGNLLTNQFGIEGTLKDPATAGEPNTVTLKGQQDGAKGSTVNIDFNSGTDRDQPVTISEKLNYEFKPVTDLQKKFQDSHPNTDLGHIVHLNFRVKATSGGELTTQLMEENSPYKQSLSERIDLGQGAKAKDSAGYITYDGYAVVPTTARTTDSSGATKNDGLDLKFTLNGGQPKGQVYIEDLKIQEVSSAPGIDPNKVIQTYETGSPDAHDDSFMLGANSNHLVDSNTRLSDDTLNNFVKTAQTDHPGDLKNQLKEIGEKSADYIKENSYTPEQKLDYLKQLKSMGVNTITIPIYWSQIENKQGKPDYSKVDDLVDMAKQAGMKVKLHPLVWADCYPEWLHQDFTAAKAKDPKLTEDQYTQSVIRQHIDQTLTHFGEKFGGEIAAVEVNEMNSTEQLAHPKLDEYGRVVRNASGNAEMIPVHNGLTQWIQDAGAAPVTNQIDGWIKDSLSKNPGLANTKLFENEYYIDQNTASFDSQLNQSPNHPAAFGIEAHQFLAAHPEQNESDPLLAIYQKLQTRQPNGAKNYVSELTVETTPAPDFDESKMSPAVQKAEREMAQYRAEHHEGPLTIDQRKAEEQQAEEMLCWYKLAANNKNTIGITLWDGSEKNAWLQNTGGVLDRDMEPKIAFFAVQDYIRELKTAN
jgi:GH35 family endo-1,4-beta-xylanase